MTGRITEVGRPGLLFDVLDDGPLDGIPVVLLHGFPERSSCWRHVAPLLHDRGLRTLALDQRGYSPRARPRRRRDHTLARLVEDAALLTATARARTGRTPHAVGHDWGAAVAWGLAARRPSPVRSLTALSVPHPVAFGRAALRSRQLARSWYLAAFALPLLPERLAQAPGGPLDRLLARSGMSAEDLARFRREIVDDGALPGALGWYRALPLPGAAPRAGRIRIPTTMVWGDRDAAVDRWGPAHTADLVTADYELRVLPGVDHWIPTQAPRACADAVTNRVLEAESATVVPEREV